MHANSRTVQSNQPGPHEQLSAVVARHAATQFRKPVSDVNLAAFTTSIAAWRAQGSPPLILDAGCGVGLSTGKLAQTFPAHFVIGVDQSADRLGRERVIAGVDCGFSVHAGSNSLDPEIVWAKLAALAQGAEIASRKYWG